MERFVGVENENFQCDGTLSTILSKGSLQLKVIVTSGETNAAKINKLGGKVLGLQWDPTLDCVTFNFLLTLTMFF